MISDEERREKAKKMREYDVAGFKESAIVPFLECLGHGYTDWRGILDELADLIDRPTCEMKSIPKSSYRVCSRCGAFVRRDAVTNCTEVIPVRRCPNCGARVKASNSTPLGGEGR